MKKTISIIITIVFSLGVMPIVGNAKSDILVKNSDPRISAIISTMPAGTLTNGLSRSIASYKFAFENEKVNKNKSSLVNLKSVTITVTHSPGVEVADLYAYYRHDPEHKTYATTTAPGKYTFYIETLERPTEPNSEAELTIEASVSGVSIADHLTTAIENVATDVTYNDGLHPDYLPYTTVTGATLSN